MGRREAAEPDVRKRHAGVPVPWGQPSGGGVHGAVVLLRIQPARGRGRAGGQDRDDDGNVQVRRVGEAGEHDRPHGNDAGSRQPVPLPGILLRYRIRVLLSPEPVL